MPEAKARGLQMSLKERLFRRYLTHVTRPAVVRRAVSSLRLRPLADRPAPERARVRVAAVQLQSFYARSVADYVAGVGGPLREAVAQGAHLVAFPEYVTLPLMGLLPGVGQETGGGKDKAKDGGAGRFRLADVVRFMEPVLNNVYFTLFPALARAGRVYIMGGSTPLPDRDGNVYNAGFLFGPDGSVIGSGRKVHLFPRERREGLSPGSEFEVFETEIGRVSLPICMDATYFETYRLAALLGAEIVAAPVADVDPEGYNYWKHLRGAWPRVQENPVYAVQSTLVGDFLGEPMSGKTSIFAPMELTLNGDGILAQCAEPTGPGLAVADLDLEALARFREEHPVFSRLNLEIIRNYVPQVYERFARRRRASMAPGPG